MAESLASRIVMQKFCTTLKKFIKNDGLIIVIHCQCNGPGGTVKEPYPAGSKGGKMKWHKFTTIIVCMLFVSSAFSTALNNRMEAKNDDTMEVLSMKTIENITVLENGNASIFINSTISSSPLADMYRNALGAPSNISTGKIIPVPEKMTIYGVINISNETSLVEANISKMDIPVREQFYDALFLDHYFLYGFEITPAAAYIMPRGANNEMKISVEATSEGFARKEVKVIAAPWEIYIGPQDENETGLAFGHLLTQVKFIQGFLDSIDGRQQYYHEWNIAILLPEGSTILNEDELDNLGWKLFLGNDSFIDAQVTANGRIVTLQQVIVVGEEPIAMEKEDLIQYISSFRVFKIDYEMGGNVICWHSLKTNGVNLSDWSYKWSTTISPGGYSATFGGGGAQATITFTPSMEVSGYIGWRFSWFSLKSFTAWMKFEPSITVGIEATASMELEKTWQKQLFTLRIARFSFWVGFIPVWANLEFTGILQLKYGIDGKVTIAATATASVWFKIGVRWTSSNGWEDLCDKGVNLCELKGPSISAEANAFLRPSLKMRLQLMVYSLAGPFVEFEPYAEGSISVKTNEPSTWKIEIGSALNAGITFAGFLKSLLDLEDYEFNIAKWIWKIWSGTIIPPKPPKPKIYVLKINAITPEFGGTNPGIGEHKITEGQTIMVRAIPKTGYRFGYWLLDGVKIFNNPISIKMVKNHTLTAVFQARIDISIRDDKGGHKGGNTNPSPGRHWFDVTTEQKVQATPTKGSSFDHWELDGKNAGNNNPIKITMDKNHNLIAFFKYVPYHDIGFHNASLFYPNATMVENEKMKEMYVERGKKIGVIYHFGNFGTENESYIASICFNGKEIAKKPEKIIASTQKNIGQYFIIDTSPFEPGRYNVTLKLEMKRNKDMNLSNNQIWAGDVIIEKKGVSLSLISPRDRYVYIFGIPVMPFPPDYQPSMHFTLIIGSAFFVAIAECSAKIEKVEFWIDGKLYYSARFPPYICLWMAPAGASWHHLNVVAYCKNGRSTMESRKIASLGLLPYGG